MDPTETLDTTESELALEDQPCAGGGVYGSPAPQDTWIVLLCDALTCAESYVGRYCVSESDFLAWSEANCPGCYCRFDRALSGSDDYEVCYNCCDGSERCSGFAWH